MRRKKIAATTVAVALLLTGCNQKEIVTDYPSVSQSGNGEIVNEDVVPDKVEKNIENKEGKITFKIKAEVTGNTSEPMPVYEVKKKDFTNEELIEMCDKLYGKDAYDFVIPVGLADKKYLDSRYQKVFEIQNDYILNEKTVPAAFAQEMYDITRAIEAYDDNEYKISMPEKPGWVNLGEYYKEKVGEDVSDRFFAVEGMIGDDYWEFDAIDYDNTITIRMYKILMLEERPTYLQFESDEKTPLYMGLNEWLTKEEAEKIAENYFQNTGIQGFSLNNVNSAIEYAIEYDDFDENGVSYSNVKNIIAYQVNYSRLYDGKMQLFDYYSDYLGNEYFYTGKSPTLYDLPYLYGNEEEIYGTKMTVKTDGSCYENISLAVDENGVFAMVWASPMEIVEKKTESAVLLEFDKIMDLAENELGKTEINTTYYNDTITSIELKMARIKDDGGTYTMVPAWYFVAAGLRTDTREDTKVCINAIDGSIIDLKNDGVKK